jgi:hypothetical protein
MPTTITTRQIVLEWLMRNEYDGLYKDDCGCFLDDLFPCLDCNSGCTPGHRVPDPDDPQGYICGPRVDECPECGGNAKRCGCNNIDR